MLCKTEFFSAVGRPLKQVYETWTVFVDKNSNAHGKKKAYQCHEGCNNYVKMIQWQMITPAQCAFHSGGEESADLHYSRMSYIGAHRVIH